MVNLPNFVRRREKLEPIRFEPVTKVFQPQRMIRMRQDVNGWADRRARIKWQLSAGKEYAIDEGKAREFCIKGYADPVGWEVNASQDEIAQTLSSVTVINMGNHNG